LQLPFACIAQLDRASFAPAPDTLFVEIDENLDALENRWPRPRKKVATDCGRYDEEREEHAPPTGGSRRRDRGSPVFFD